MVPPSNQPAPRIGGFPSPRQRRLARLRTVAGTRLWLSRDRLYDLGMDDARNMRFSKTSRVGMEGVASAPSAKVAMASENRIGPSRRSGRFITIGVIMRIGIDLNRCLGYAQCVPLAPEVLKLSGEEALTYDPNPDDSQRLRVLRAAASCPVQAIIVDQLD